MAGSLGRLAGGGSGGISSWGAAFTSTGTGALAASSLATNWYITIMANTSTSRPAIPMAKVSDRIERIGWPQPGQWDALGGTVWRQRGQRSPFVSSVTGSAASGMSGGQYNTGPRAAKRGLPPIPAFGIGWLYPVCLRLILRQSRALFSSRRMRCFLITRLTPSFRRSLPETGCLSRGLPHGKLYAWPCPPKPLSTRPRPSEGEKKLVGRRKRLPHKGASPCAATWDRRFRLSTLQSQRLFFTYSASACRNPDAP